MYTAEEINKIINLKDRTGRNLNIFSLRGAIILTDNEPNTCWTSIVESSINFDLKDFEDCTTEKEVLDTYEEQLWLYVKKNLINC